ncbi:MAG: DUF192 domain-containing protein [Candidatus Nanohaloarchaea archaeon]|nr:DUF192 domain-containing protein [Candidatus Nanohaloarchaea archaeon]
MQARAFLAAAAFAAILAAALTVPGGGTATVHTPSHDLTVAVADTPAERRQGLMNRSAVPRDGMLFTYPAAAPRTFWMKDTQLQLDIVFIGANGTVLNVEAADPEPGAAAENLTRYRSDGPARYVLELPQGRAAAVGLVPGATVTVERR